jgi:hypothetical protein
MRTAHTVDVIDSARGVLASVTVQNMTVQPFDSRYARRIVTDPAGFVQVEIWEVVFQDGRAFESGAKGIPPPMQP